MLALALGCDPSRRDADPAPNVLLITVDTLRADHLGCYGHPAAISPAIDALAAQGTRFLDATVQRPKTWPSIASLFTGQYPRTTGLQLRRRVLPEHLERLSTLFRGAGYDTAAVVANFNIGRVSGFDRGFDHFVESWQEAWAAQAGDAIFANAPGRVKQFTNAARVSDEALAWLAGRESSSPFFLWLHYMDPHGPYTPPERYAGLFEDRHSPEPVALGRLPGYQRQRDPMTGAWIRDLGHYKRQYEREVRHADDEIGRLLARMEESGWRENTLIALTADHGESLGEHDYYLEHGKLSYQVNARVPLILVFPGRVPAAGAVETPVGLIDLAPTLLELAGLQVPEAFEGASLVGLATGAPDSPAPEYVFMESGYDVPRPQLTVRQGPWKLIHVQSPAERVAMAGSAFELYDLASDPGETANLASAHPERVRELARVLAAWYFRDAGPPPESQPVDLEALDPRAREMLRALGYLDSESEGAPAPHYSRE